jgi:hypothetical protein
VGDGYVWWGVLPIVGVGMGRSYPMGMYPLPSLGASRPTLNVGRKTNTGHAREKKKERRKRGGSGSLDMGAMSGVKQCFCRLMTR